MRVQTERRVVDEDLVIHSCEVDASFDSVREGVEGAEHVISVEAQVEREVVPGTSGDTDVRDLVPHCHRRDQGLRAVTTGHPDHVRAVGDGLLGELGQIVAWTEQQRLDPTLECLLGQLPALGFPTSRLGIDDQHSSPCRPAFPPGRREHQPLLVVAHGVARGDTEEEDRPDQHQQQRVVRLEEPDQATDPQEDPKRSEYPPKATMRQDVPTRERKEKDEDE